MGVVHWGRCTMTDNTLFAISTEELLYDEDTFDDVCDELYEREIPVKPTEIKKYVDTSAKLYEIRTAYHYWCGDDNTHRTSDRVWERCKMADDNVGRW